MSDITPEVKKQITKQLGADVANMIDPDKDVLETIQNSAEKAEEKSIFLPKEEADMEAAFRGETSDYEPKKRRHEPIVHPFKSDKRGFNYKLKNNTGIGSQSIQFIRYKPRKVGEGFALAQNGTTKSAVTMMLIDKLKKERGNEAVREQAIRLFNQALAMLDKLD